MGIRDNMALAPNRLIEFTTNTGYSQLCLRAALRAYISEIWSDSVSLDPEFCTLEYTHKKLADLNIVIYFWQKIHFRNIVGSNNFGPWACHLASEKFVSITFAIHGGFHCSSVPISHGKLWVRIRLLLKS